MERLTKPAKTSREKSLPEVGDSALRSDHYVRQEMLPAITELFIDVRVNFAFQHSSQVVDQFNRLTSIRRIYGLLPLLEINKHNQ